MREAGTAHQVYAVWKDVREGATLRECITCGDTKPLTEFYPHNQRKSGISPYCKPCHNERASRNRRLRRERDLEGERRKTRDWQFRTLYGITMDDYDRLYEEQGGKCAICPRVCEVLNVDHCHSTGRVRGLLCWNCNTAIGKFYDDVELLREAVKYLESTNVTQR